MDSELYKLYRKNKVQIFELIYDVCKHAPLRPIFGFSNKEEEDEYDKKFNAYLEERKPKLINDLKELGFKMEENK